MGTRKIGPEGGIALGEERGEADSSLKRPLLESHR